MEGDDSKNVQIKFENLEYKTIEKKLENKRYLFFLLILNYK